MEVGRGGACVPARVAPKRAHPSLAGVHHAQSTNISTHGNATFTGGGCALYAWKCLLCGWGRALCGWKRLLYGWGRALLRMETPLRGRSGGHTGAAPTISHVAPCPKVAGRGSADGLKRKRSPEEAPPMDKIEKDCRKRLCRWTKTRKGCRKRLRRRTKTRKGCRKRLCRWTKTKKGRRKRLRRRTKTRNDCRKRLCRWTKTENTSQNAHFWRGFSAEYAKKMAFLAFGLRNPTFFYYFCG